MKWDSCLFYKIFAKTYMFHTFGGNCMSCTGK